MICIRCGTQNPEGRNHCQSCNASLPRISESVAAAPPERINVHYDQLKEAGEKVVNQGITMEQFLETLDRIEAKINTHLQEVEEMQIEDEVRAMIEEQLNTGVLGIHQFLEGIAEMRLYAEDQNQEHITYGMESIFNGNENLNLALQMARDGIQRLKDMGVDSEINIRENPR